MACNAKNLKIRQNTLKINMNICVICDASPIGGTILCKWEIWSRVYAYVFRLLNLAWPWPGLGLALAWPWHGLEPNTWPGLWPGFSKAWLYHDLWPSSLNYKMLTGVMVRRTWPWIWSHQTYFSCRAETRRECNVPWMWGSVLWMEIYRWISVYAGVSWWHTR